MVYFPDEIQYSEKYINENYEYRHVILPKDLFKLIRGIKILSEDQWRGLGVCQSRGWVHYDIFKPEPNILLFRKPLTNNNGICEMEDYTMDVINELKCTENLN